jgi:hypothetical protein
MLDSSLLALRYHSKRAYQDRGREDEVVTSIEWTTYRYTLVYLIEECEYLI